MRLTDLHPLSMFVGAGLTAAALLSVSWMQVDAAASEEEPAMQVRFLEIVTPDVDATCATLAEVHGVTFSDPVPEFGGARTAALTGGNVLSVRAPMRADEDPVVRPYLLVDDIEAAVASAAETGGEIAHPPLEIPGQGTFAIYLQGGNQYGFWQD